MECCGGIGSDRLVAADGSEALPDAAGLWDVEVEVGLERVAEMIGARDALPAEAVCRHPAQAVVLKGEIAIRRVPPGEKSASFITASTTACSSTAPT